MSKLTIGMCFYDDFDGVYFTVQSIRLFHKEILNNIEWVFIDNNPSSPQSDLTRDFVALHVTEPYKYVKFDKYTGTSIRNGIFTLSETPYTLCVDCHVLLEPGSLKKLIEYYDDGHDDGNLLQGPLINDSLNATFTHFKPGWKKGMFGAWDTDTRYKDASTPPFEIEAQGLGVFSCRTSAWLGFNPAFRGFGGEEFYINNKFKQQGKKTMCLPFLGWLHRFSRESIPYPNNWYDRYRNYLIGRVELGQDVDDVESHFETLVEEELKETIRTEVIELFNGDFEIKSCNCKGTVTEIKDDPSEPQQLDHVS